MSNLTHAPIEDLRARLESLPELRPFPAVATRLMAACKDPDTNSRALAEIIRCDPTLVARLLRAANSSIYGFCGEISTIDHAVVVLGFRAVTDLGTSLIVADLFAEGEAGREQRATLWRHSLGCGVIARLLAAEHDEIVPEEAFLAGILHDIGKLVFFDLIPDQYAVLVETTGRQSDVDKERESFGISHDAIGQKCGQQWGLPDEITGATACHHDLQAAKDQGDLAQAIYTANALCKAWGIGSPSPLDESELAELYEQLPWDAGLIEQVRAQAPEDFEAMARTCSP